MLMTLSNSRYNKIISSNYDDFPDKAIEIDINYYDLENMINNPVEVDKKENISYFYPISHEFIEHESYADSNHANFLTMLTLDIDNKNGDVKKEKGKGYVSIEMMIRYLKKHNYQYALYTSFSHKPDHHKFRVILPLDRPLIFDRFISKPFKGALKRLMPWIDPNTLQHIGYYYPCLTEHYYKDFNYDENAKPFSFQKNQKFMKIFDNEMKKYKRDQMIFKMKREKYKKKNNMRKERSVFQTKLGADVSQYLNTPFNNKSGNGGMSNYGLYKSIYACKLINDKDTLNQVIEKAYREGWKQKEIDQKMNSAERAIQNIT